MVQIHALFLYLPPIFNQYPLSPLSSLEEPGTGTDPSPPRCDQDLLTHAEFHLSPVFVLLLLELLPIPFCHYSQLGWVSKWNFHCQVVSFWLSHRLLFQLCDPGFTCCLVHSCLTSIKLTLTFLLFRHRYITPNFAYCQFQECSNI